jgi:hypothetical protein
MSTNIGYIQDYWVFGLGPTSGILKDKDQLEKFM